MSPVKAPNDGVVNRKALFRPCFTTPLFIGIIPIANYLTHPGGLVEKAVNGLVQSVVFAGTAGSTSNVSTAQKITTLGAFYTFVAFAFGGALSASAIEASCSTGRDNSAPRAQTAALTGLPLRMHSAACHCQETFAAWGIAAGLAMAVAPTNQRVVNLLGLAILSKLVYIPCYLANYSIARGVSHIFYVGSIVSATWKLARVAA